MAGPPVHRAHPNPGRGNGPVGSAGLAGRGRSLGSFERRRSPHLLQPGSLRGGTEQRAVIVDPALVGAAQAGDALALDQLLDDLLPMVRRLTTAVAPSVAEDATQEALLAIFRNLSELRNPESIVAWTRKLTIRAALRLVRDCGRDQPVDADPASHIDLGEQLIELVDALERLPVEQRTVV